MDKTMLKFKLEAKKRQIKEHLDKAKDFVMEHPAESAAMGSALIGGVVSLAKRHDRKADIRKTQRLKDEYIYDRSLGTYWKTRRPRTAGENLEIQRRKKAGESLGDILADMRLL